MVAVPVADLVTLNRVRNLAPPEGMLIGLATAHPVEPVSVWLAGTGVNAGVPLAFFSVPVAPALNVFAAGQADPDGGLVTQAMWDPAKLEPLKLLVPMSAKSLVSPSLGESGKLAPKFRLYRHQLDCDKDGVAVELKPKTIRFMRLDTMSSSA